MKSFKWDRCGYELRSRQRLIMNMRSHTCERPYKCSVRRCGMKFNRESAVKSHVKAKHNSERPFACEFPGCLHAAKTSATLIQHKKVHSDKRTFSCPNAGCSFRARSKSAATRHVKLAHIKAKTSDCSKIDYKTVGSGHSKRHIRRHSARIGFKCSCSQCSESFKTWSDIMLHFSNWKEERAVQRDLPGCGENYTNAKALNEHRKLIHSKQSHACPNCNCSLHTKPGSVLATHMILHEERNEKTWCSVDQGELADSLGFACMLCDFVGYSVEAALDHALLHRHHTFPIRGATTV